MRVLACVCGCGRPRVVTRGLASACYQHALARVRAGEVTWALLEAAGEALPPRTPAAKREWAYRPGRQATKGV